MKKNILFAAVVLAVIAAATSGLSLSAGSPQATVSTAAGVISIKGNETQTTAPAKFAAGAYVVRRTAGEGFMSIAVKDTAGNILFTTFFSNPAGTFLLIVGSEMVKAGDLIFEIMGTAAWTVTLTKAEASGAVALPQVLSAAEMTNAVSKPFKAAAGTLTISYTYKSVPKGTGTLTVCDIATGKTLPMREMMYAGKISGGFSVPVASAGIYIAQAGFPLGSGGGEVKIVQ